MQNYDYLVNINLLFLNLMTLGPRQRGTVSAKFPSLAGRGWSLSIALQ